jgi:hypothetical protein
MCEALMTTAAQRPDRSPCAARRRLLADLRQLLRRLAATASILHDRGLRRGDALGLMMLNPPEFHVVDAAAMLLGATPFSLYNTSPAEQIAFVDGRCRQPAGGRRAGASRRRARGRRRRRAGRRARRARGGDEDFDLEAHWRAVGPMTC